MPTKRVYNHLAKVEAARDAIEKDLEALEKLTHKSEHLYQSLNARLDELTKVFTGEKSFFLLDKVARLKALVNKRHEAFGYDPADFDIYYRFLDKLLDFSKDELVSPLILPNVEKLVNQRVRQKAKEGKDSYITFKFRDLHYITPKTAYKKIRNFNPYKKIQLQVGKQTVYLGPLAGEITEYELDDYSRFFILLLVGNVSVYGYYADSLEEEVVITEKVLTESLTPLSRPIPHCGGVFRLRGVNYYYLSLD